MQYSINYIIIRIMSKSKILNGIIGVSLLSLLQYSYTTDDILPALELTASDTNPSEN